MVPRRVQRMRIRADGADQARSAAIYLEDALRTASFPNLPRNGVVYIRRLDLGRIGPRPDRSKLSRHVDECLLSLPASAIRRGDAATDLTEAEAVWFPDPVAPLLVCAERILRNRPIRAWYWLRVLGLKKPPAMPPHLGMIMARVEQLSRPELAVPALIRHMARTDGLVKLVEALPMETVRRQVSWLLPQVVVDSPSRARAEPRTGARSGIEAAPSSTAMPRPGLSMHWYPKLQAAARRWPRETPRVAWLALVAHSLEGQQLRSDQWQAEMGEITALKLTAGPMPVGESDDRDAPPSPRAATAADAGVASQARDPRPEWNTTKAAEIPPKARRKPHGAPSKRRLSPDQNVDWMGAGLWGGEYSPASGLLFMLPVWFRLGLAESLENHDALWASGFVACLLRRLGWWLGMAEDDPMLSWLPPMQGDELSYWTAPDGWWRILESWLSRHGFVVHECADAIAITGLTDRVMLRFGMGLEQPVRCRQGEPWQSDSIMNRLADSWLRMSAGWLHRRDLSIRRLVLRPGAVAATDTHVDICFHLNHTDLAVRMAALDLDPGWVPSLGRVIQYHYVNHDA